MIWNKMDGRFNAYLRDESRYLGNCREICFPADPDQLRQALADCAASRIPVTIQGARTGIAGAGAPNGGRLISTEKLDEIRMEGASLYAYCGARLKDIYAAARVARLSFPPTPTEDTATIGGSFACAAAGPNCLRYGGVADHILSADLLLADGRRWTVERGRYRFDHRGCPLPDGGRLALTTPLPPEGTPRWGFSPVCGLDLLDLFCGSEGTLAVLEGAQLKLETPPAQNWGLLFFFGNEQNALHFAAELTQTPLPEAQAAAIEYLDSVTLTLILELQANSSRLAGLPPFPARHQAAVYAEVESTGTAPPERSLLTCLNLFCTCGGDEADTWAAAGDAELERLRLLRHAAAEAVNVRLDLCRRALPELTKLCAAYQTPLERLEQVATVYRTDLDQSGIPGAVFGHAGTGRLHVNLLPERQDQLAPAVALLDRWAGLVQDWGGQALAENGAGKCRCAFFARWAPSDQLALMGEIKSFFDPTGLLGPGTLLPARRCTP